MHNYNISITFSSVLFSLAADAQTDMCDSCWQIFNARQYEQASNCFTKAIASVSEFNSCLFYFRAYSNFELIKYDEAKNDIQEIISRIDSAESAEFILGNTYFLLARIYSKENKIKEELDNLLHALDYIETANLVLTIGYAYGKVQQYSKSIDYSTRAISLDPNSDKAYNNRALANIKLNNLREAKSDIDSALAINPENPYIYKHRALLFFELKKRELACKDLQKAIEMGYREFGNEADKNEVDSLIDINCK